MDISKTLAALTPLEKDMLTIYAIVLTPLTNDQAAELASVCNLKTKEGKKITRQVFNQTRKKLTDDLILVQPNTFGYYNHSAFIGDPSVRETVMYEALQAKTLQPLATTIQNHFGRHSLYSYNEHLSKGLRNARIALYLGEFKQLATIEEETMKMYYEKSPESFTDLYATIFAMPFRAAWFDTFPKELRQRVLPDMTEISILNGFNTQPLEQYIEKIIPRLAN